VIAAYDHVQVAMPAGREVDARVFYGELLEMLEMPRPQALAARGGCWFESGAVVLHLGVEDPFSPARKAHPAFRVEDLDGTRRRLEDAGYTCVAADDLPGVQRFHVADVFGNRLEFVRA
jgi:hypothetical protein